MKDQPSPLQESQLAGPGNRLAAGGDAQLAVERRRLRLDGVAGQEQFPGLANRRVVVGGIMVASYAGISGTLTPGPFSHLRHRSRLAPPPLASSERYEKGSAPPVLRPIRIATHSGVGPSLSAHSSAVHLLAGEHGLGFALEVDVGVAADVDRDPFDRAAGERVRVLARVVGGDRLAAVAADAQALARE
jgi:hypothetical protein